MTLARAQERPGEWKAGPRSRAVFDEEQGLIAPGLQSIALLSGLTVERGEGAWIYDADGRKYLDFAAGVGVASVGHAHPDYVKAVSEQVSKISVGSFTSPRRASFLKNLASVTPDGLNRVQLYSSGAEAVEAALRLAKSRTKKYEVIGFWGGFHGKTGGVLGVLGDDFKHGYGPLMPGLHLSPYPDSRQCPLGARGEHDCGAHCLDFLRGLVKRSTAGAVAAIIVEPIQGTAGNLMPPSGFLKGLSALAREIGALLIADEMITGFGRTGRWFGVEHDGIAPDIMTIGKGMAGGFPVSGVVTTEEIAASEPFSKPSGSSSSYGGNPLASAAADATLKILMEEDLPSKSREIGAALLKRFEEIRERNPMLGSVRGRGLMIGLDLVDPRAGGALGKAACRRLFGECLKRGLIAMSYANPVRINPPLVIKMEEALRGADIFEEALEATAASL